jgi:hypothetical protein
MLDVADDDVQYWNWNRNDKFKERKRSNNVYYIAFNAFLM